MSHYNSQGDYIYLTAREFEKWVDSVELEYRHEYTFTNRSKVSVYFVLREEPNPKKKELRVEFVFTALFDVPGKGLCYASHGQTPEVYRISAWSGAYHLYGPGARASKTWELCRQLLGKLKPEEPQPEVEDIITLSKEWPKFWYLSSYGKLRLEEADGNQAIYISTTAQEVILLEQTDSGAVVEA